MDNPIQIALVQTPLIWESPDENRAMLDTKLSGIDADLVILAEMFTTGFSMNPAPLAETMQGETVRWMLRKATQLDAALCGSVIIREDGQYFNRLLFVEPSGTIHSYNKRHLFSLAGENMKYSTTGERTIIEFRGWKICPLICYDLRFPVFSRNDVDYDLLIYVANWPEPRIAAWDALIKARAIENMAWVVAVNRVGSDNNGHRYPGHSQVVDHLGNTILDAEGRETVAICTIGRDRMIADRGKLGFLNDRDSFTVT